ncbi:MAG: hypothetical protein AAFZ46_06760, partial [Pseudomonadota bacterium]
MILLSFKPVRGALVNRPSCARKIQHHHRHLGTLGVSVARKMTDATPTPYSTVSSHFIADWLTALRPL